MRFRQFQGMEARMRAMMQRSAGDMDMSAIELFRNLSMAHNILSGMAERNVSKYNLSIAKFRILFWLQMIHDEGTDGGGMLPSELSKMSGVTPNTMSALLNSLRESSLIEQVNHPNDRRKRIIKITRSGGELLREVGPSHYHFIRELFSDLSEEEKQILITLLRKTFISIKSKMGECEEETALQDTSSDRE